MSWFCLSLIVVVAAIFLSLFQIIPLLDDERMHSSPIQEDSLKKSSLHFQSSQSMQLERTPWNGTSCIIEAVISHQPIIFHDPSVSKWQALQWDLKSLTSKWPILFDVLSANQNLFLFHEEGQQGLLDDTGSGNFNLPEVIPEYYFQKFLEEIHNPSVFLYYSTNYAVMESLAQIQEDTNWKDYRILESFDEIMKRLNFSEDTISLRQPAPILAISHPGVTLQGRYQVHHIIRTQIIGRTRYVLFPPAKHASLFLFPAIHSCHQQSQIVLEEEYGPVTTFKSNEPVSKFLQVPNLIVELSPGESLYIPPYWLVRVENLESTSVFLDVRSLSKEQVLLSEAQSIGVLLGNVTTADEKIVAAQVYAVHFLSRIEGLKSVERFANSHYLSRYSRLFPTDSLFMSKLKKTFHCLSDKPALHESILLKLDREGIKSSAQYAANRVNDPAVSKGVKWIWVGDYLDQIARWAMNDPNLAVGFITTCLQFDSKIQAVEEVPGPSVMKIGGEK